MIYIVTVNDKEYEVEVEKGKAAILKTSSVRVKGTEVNIPEAAPAAPAAKAVQTAELPGRGQTVRAPMPGTILDIKAEKGSTVKKGAVIAVLEAMKMENEILAPCDGIVEQVFVSRGSAVETKAPIISIR